MDSRKLSYQQELCQIQKDSTLPVKAKCCLFVFVDMNLSCAVFISTLEKDGSLECSCGYPFRYGAQRKRSVLQIIQLKLLMTRACPLNREQALCSFFAARLS